jgi:D-alanyl-D-alanine carboxypeptidase
MNIIKPYNPLQAASRFDQYFGKIVAKNPRRPVQIKVYSRQLGLDYTYPSDSANQSYHIASIGKMFTATLVQMLAEDGLLTPFDPIPQYFSSTELSKLFVYQGADHAHQVTLAHLLGHTSGIADYFEGATLGGTLFIDEILSHPQQHWTPQSLLAFSREHQAAVGVPGQRFNYSDTGYILLGLIIEKVTGKSFAANLVERIFHPLNMHDSYLMFYSEPENTPQKKLAPIWFNDTEISSYESLSCDWAGGGIVSTSADLLKFNQALRGGLLVGENSLAAMDDFKHKFRPGIYYGLGMMEIRFKEFFFLLGRLPKIRGHIGILSTHLFYDPPHDAHIIMNFGSNTRMVESFKALIAIENVLQKIE